MKKITDPNLLKELYDTEADWKLLIGYRFKGALPPIRTSRRGIRTRGRTPGRKNGNHPRVSNRD